MRGKPHIERTLESVATLFCQFVSGYLGRSAEHRGSRVEDEPLWSLLELQELLDEWILACCPGHRMCPCRSPESARSAS